MEEKDLFDLIEKILNTKVETQTIECKAARKGCPENLYDTFSSFSNQDGGGTIVFGIDESNGFDVCGVYDLNDLQKQLQNKCGQMEPPTRGFFTSILYKEKPVLAMEIPGIERLLRPCFYKSKGKYGGSFIRVGESDMPMSEFEIYQYEAYKRRIKDDIRIIDDNEIKLFDNEKHEKYLRLIKEKRDNLKNNVSDDEIDQLMGIFKDENPTLSGVMIFSKYPQTYFPQYSIIFTKIPGKSMSDLGLDGERFLADKKFTGPIDTMIDTFLDYIREKMGNKTIIDEYGKKKEKPEYPLIALREAVLNALIHRDYSQYSEGMPVRIEMYTNRIEITNPGQIYGSSSIEDLGKSRMETRNVVLADIAEVLEITENRYSGIPTIRNEMRNNNLPQPVFKSQRGEFKTILYNSFQMDQDNAEESILSYCSIPRTKDEIVRFVGKSRNYVISRFISPLVNSGKLKLTIPDKPQSPFQKYYS